MIEMDRNTNKDNLWFMGGEFYVQIGARTNLIYVENQESWDSTKD